MIHGTPPGRKNTVRSKRRTPDREHANARRAGGALLIAFRRCSYALSQRVDELHTVAGTCCNMTVAI